MDVGEWLRGLALAQYEVPCRDNNIHSMVLRRLTADDLRDLGVNSVGHRRRLLDAIDALGEDKPSEELGKPLTRDAAGNAERRQLSVMFCDLVGSTALAAQLDPEDLRGLMGAYHAATSEEIRRFDGFVAQYLGDGVLAYFGYPRAHEDDAERAVRAGLRLVERVGALDVARPLEVRVAIATGLVVVGDLIGTGDAQERGAVGQTPNLAARLQGMAPANGVLIDEATRRLVRDLFEYRDLGLIEARGLLSAVRVSQVLGATAVESRFEAMRDVQLPPLVGRGEEIELLLRRWMRAKDGEGQIVLLSGEPGIGKSRLASSLHQRLRTQTHTLLRYSCSEQNRDTALYPVILHAQRAAGFKREDATKTRFDKLKLLLAQTGENIAEITGLMADLLGLADEGRHPMLPPDPQRRRELILGGLLQQLEALAHQRPVLMIFEDAHWADATSLEFLDRIVERVVGLPILLVITFRPEFVAPWVGQAHVSALSLNRLANRDIAAMVDGIIAGKTLPPELLDRIIERTDGIPLFVEELTKNLLEGGLLREKADSYVLDGPLPPLAIPSSLQALLLARLDRLTGAMEVAQVGAALGRDFSYDLLSAIVRCTEVELHMALGQLTDAGLIFCRGMPPLATYRFKHVLVQDAAYSTLLRAARQKLHTAIAQTLEQSLAAHSEQLTSASEHAAVLADHWLKGENREKALYYALDAARKAARVYAHPEAINRYWQALELLRSLPPTRDRNQLHIETVCSLLDTPASARDEAEEGQLFRHVDQALALATEAGQLAAVARLEALKGIYWGDEVLLTNAIAHAEASGDVEARSRCEFLYGTTLGKLGRCAAALEHLTLAIEIMEGRGDRWRQAMNMASGARCYNARAGRLEQSLIYAARARAEAEKLGDARLQAWCAMEAEPYMYMGLWDKAVEVAEKWLPVAWEIREWPVVHWSSAWLAIAFLKRKRPEQAKQILDRVFAEVPARALDNRSSFAMPYSHMAVAQLHLETGHPNLALNAAQQAVVSSQQIDAPLEEGAAHRVLGQVYEAMGAPHAEADAAFRRSLAVLEKIESPPELAQTLLAYGRFRRGDNSRQDRALIERALRLFQEMGATGWVQEARAALNLPSGAPPNALDRT